MPILKGLREAVDLLVVELHHSIVVEPRADEKPALTDEERIGGRYPETGGGSHGVGLERLAEEFVDSCDRYDVAYNRTYQLASELTSHEFCTRGPLDQRRTKECLAQSACVNGFVHRHEGVSVATPAATEG